MQQRFVGQPFDENLNLVDFIQHATQHHYRKLRIAVAWAKRSGLARIWDALANFRHDGGHVQLIIGVSEGGASKEGLELALSGSDDSYVFHDPRRTFHPKVYFASSDLEHSLLVGSSNLTAGGLSWNYEASLWLEWKADEDDGLTNSVTEWFERLLGESNSCLPLTADLIENMINSGDLVIGTELGSRRIQKKRSDAPEDNDSAVTTTVSGMFKPVVGGLRKLPAPSSSFHPIALDSPIPVSHTHLDARVTDGQSILRATGDPPPPLDDVTRRWFKEMDHTAAQQVKSASTNPTGNLRLSQGDAPINHKVYFRKDFFGGLPWTPSDGKASEQEVMVRFRIWIDGQDHGVQDIRLSHDPRRIAGQGNVPTVLHWGPLSPVLRATNYIGFYINLECLAVGGFNLVISRAPRGDYLL